jgi:hypothetical protein
MKITPKKTELIEFLIFLLSKQILFWESPNQTK